MSEENCEDCGAELCPECGGCPECGTCSCVDEDEREEEI